MLVTCKSCGTSFQESLGRCVACRAEFVPSKEEMIELARSAAVVAFERRAKRSEVRRELVDRFALSDGEIDDAVHSASAVMRSRSRKHGSQIAGSGILLVLIAGAVFVLTGGVLVASGSLALGVVMFLAGSLKAFTGWNLTGRDDE